VSKSANMMDPCVLLKGPGVLLKDPGVLLKDPGVGLFSSRAQLEAASNPYWGRLCPGLRHSGPVWVLWKDPGVLVKDPGVFFKGLRLNRVWER